MALKIYGSEAEVYEQINSLASAVITQPAYLSPQIALSEVEAQVIELVNIERQMQLGGFADMVKRREELRKLLLASDSVLSAAPSEVVSFPSPDGGLVHFGGASNDFSLSDKVALKAYLGKEVFDDLAKFSVTDLRKTLSALELDKVGKFSPGSRTMKVVVPKE